MRLLVAWLVALIAIGHVGRVQAVFSPPSWYKCHLNRCLLPGCRCARTVSPLAWFFTPQFILISSDDSVTRTGTALLGNVTAAGVNPNGCPLPVTWFTRSEKSSCFAIKQRFAVGDEFAVHTVTHQLLNDSVPTDVMTADVLGARTYLYDKCGLPEGSVKGYRAPYLTSNPKLRTILKDSGFLYDSSFSSVVADMTDRLFPFTLHKGLPDANCPSCGPDESCPGVWEVPVWALNYNGSIYTMDPGMARVNSRGRATARRAFDVLRDAFDTAYYGNRAPVPLNLHQYWFDKGGERLGDAQRFIEYVLLKKDVYFVTYTQLVEWMRAPVPRSQIAEWLKHRCGPPDAGGAGSGGVKAGRR